MARRSILVAPTRPRGFGASTALHCALQVLNAARRYVLFVAFTKRGSVDVTGSEGVRDANKL
jgi:hypothetical protein